MADLNVYLVTGGRVNGRAMTEEERSDYANKLYDAGAYKDLPAGAKTMTIGQDTISVFGADKTTPLRAPSSITSLTGTQASKIALQQFNQTFRAKAPQAAQAPPKPASPPSSAPTPAITPQAAGQDPLRDPNAPKGIQNAGNHCYIASVVQMLASSDDLRTNVLAKSAAYGALQHPETITDSTVLVPLITELGMSQTTQEDPSEILDLLSSRRGLAPFRELESIKRQYHFNKAHVSEEEKQRIHAARNLDFEDTSTEVGPQAYTKLHFSDRSSQPITFETLLENSFEESDTKIDVSIPGSNRIVGIPTSTSTRFVTPPPHLLFSIRRDRLDRAKELRDVTGIPFDQTDLMSAFTLTEEPCSYQLKSFNVHQGTESTSGHYVAYVKRRLSDDSECWFECNDATIRHISEEEAKEKSKQAFLVHFEKTADSTSVQEKKQAEQRTVDQIKTLIQTTLHALTGSPKPAISAINIENPDLLSTINTAKTPQLKALLLGFGQKQADLEKMSEIDLRTLLKASLLRNYQRLQRHYLNNKDYTPIIESLSTALIPQFSAKKPHTRLIKLIFETLFADENEQSSIYAREGKKHPGERRLGGIFRSFAGWTDEALGKWYFDEKNPDLYRLEILSRLQRLPIQSREYRLQQLEILIERAPQGSREALSKESLEVSAQVGLDRILGSNPLPVRGRNYQFVGTTPPSSPEAKDKAYREMILSRYKELIDANLEGTPTEGQFNAKKAILAMKLQCLEKLLTLPKYRPYLNGAFGAKILDPRMRPDTIVNGPLHAALSAYLGSKTFVAPPVAPP